MKKILFFVLGAIVLTIVVMAVPGIFNGTIEAADRMSIGTTGEEMNLISREKVYEYIKCYKQREKEITKLPSKANIITLDGQEVSLSILFNYMDMDDLIRFSRFYYWPSVTKEFVSKVSGKTVKHMIRAYFSPCTTCGNPMGTIKDDPLARGLGDITEFYEKGTNKFMGFVIYRGEGKNELFRNSAYQKSPTI